LATAELDALDEHGVEIGRGVFEHPSPAFVLVQADRDPLDTVEGRLDAARELLRRKEYGDAASLLNPALLPEDAELALQLSWADLLADARDDSASDLVFDRLLAAQAGNREVHVAYAKRLFARGHLIRAGEVIEEVADLLPKEAKSHSLLKRIHRLRAILADRESTMPDRNEDCRLLAMKHAIRAYRDRAVAPGKTGRLGRLSLVTGSLGPGGAERQLSRTAAELEKARRAQGHFAGIPIDRPIEVLVRSHGPEQEHDFFLAEVQAAQVDLAQINLMDARAPASFGIEDKELLALLEYLPVKVNFGLRRLVPHFRETAPDVVSIWQDGACLFAGLAAIVAGVPRVQLVIRGLPPQVRRHMFQPEYEEMYRSLAVVPGVEFISNSRAAAQAYAEWLDLPMERFSIVYNGVPRMQPRMEEALGDEWRTFLAQAPADAHIAGGVFRFDTDKRPLHWIRFAARHVRSHPEARFLLVGAGRLYDHAVALAEELGVRDKIFFTGRSANVGYWMKQMDVLILMSRYEGLPNVLIEAQYLGVPVVSTPAGGASECFIEGVTGYILSCADKTDLNEASEKVAALIGRAHDPEIFEPASRDFLDKNFSVHGMLEKFLHLTCGVETDQPPRAPSYWRPSWRFS
jgi:glycosyltransferase involved in cell wall biosynthesis